MWFTLDKPTLIAAVAYIVLIFIILLPLNIGYIDPNENKTYDLTRRIILVLVLLIPIAISLYSIQCMLSGKCVLWSYVNSVFICIWVIVFAITAVSAR